jgi:hypothetical protein
VLQKLKYNFNASDCQGSLMEKVFPVEALGVIKKNFGMGGAFLSPESKPGVVEKIVGPGRYIVTLADGSQISAQGSRGLRLGNKVLVLPRIELLNEKKDAMETRESSLKESGLQLEAFFPLGFGGKKAKAFLRVYIEEKSEDFWEKRPSAVYFVFNIETEKRGKLQWSIYLKGRQISIQVFSDLERVEKEELRILVTSVEKNLQSRGFRLLVPTVYLKSFFRVPEGFRLNIKG